MHLRNLYRVFGLLILVIFSHAALGQNDVKDIESVKKTVRPHAELQYFLMQRAGQAAPKEGYRVMMILPGGHGWVGNPYGRIKQAVGYLEREEK